MVAIGKGKRKRAYARKGIKNKRFLLLILLIMVALIGIIFTVSYYQSKEVIPMRCDKAHGTCENDCDGFNFIDDDSKKSDCPDGLICCLPH